MGAVECSSVPGNCRMCREQKEAEAATEDPDGHMLAMPTQIDEPRAFDSDHQPIPTEIYSEYRWEADSYPEHAQFASPPAPELTDDDRGLKVVPEEEPQETIWEEAARATAPQEAKKPAKAKKETAPKMKVEEAPIVLGARTTAEKQPAAGPSAAPKEEPLNQPEPKLFGFPGKKLQVYLDTGFTDMGDMEQQQISSNLKNGLKRGTIQSRGAIYVIDLTDLSNATQVNPSTKKGMRLVDENHPQGEMVADGEAMVTENGDQAAGQGKKPATKKGWKMFGRK